MCHSLFTLSNKSLFTLSKYGGQVSGQLMMPFQPVKDKHESGQLDSQPTSKASQCHKMEPHPKPQTSKNASYFFLLQIWHKLNTPQKRSGIASLCQKQKVKNLRCVIFTSYFLRISFYIRLISNTQNSQHILKCASFTIISPQTCNNIISFFSFLFFFQNLLLLLKQNQRK